MCVPQTNKRGKVTRSLPKQHKVHAAREGTSEEVQSTRTIEKAGKKEDERTCVPARKHSNMRA